MNLVKVVAVASVVVLFAAPAFALERTSASRDDRAESERTASGTCNVIYSNVCTGWIWLWTAPNGFEDIVGVTMDPCCPAAVLQSTTVFSWTGLPAGYGYTGEIRVHLSDANDCPADLLSVQPYLISSGFTTHLWGVPTVGQIVLVVDTAQGIWVTDHPAAGPTGPPASGHCYATDRATHSFYYGTDASPLCPGSTLNDGIGDAEFLDWSASFNCTVPVTPMAWGHIKDLYR